KGPTKVGPDNPTPMTRSTQPGLMKFNKPDAEVQAARDEPAPRELPLLNRRTPYLAMLANMATLFGLFGTIVGMIRSFGGAAAADPTTNSTLLAEGIAESMNCTQFGIAVAVLSLIGHAFLNAHPQ